MGRSYTEQTLKILFARSRNSCAFPGCDQRLVETVEHGSGSAVIGEIAHIVGLRPGSARWEPGSGDEDRNRPENLILLCPTHHTIVDDRAIERRYSAPVLRRMKQEHERPREQRADSRRSRQALIEESVTSSLLVVESLPAFMYSARCTKSSTVAVAQAISPVGTGLHVPFFLHDGTLWSFWDLEDTTGPIAPAVDPSTASGFSAEQAWNDPDLQRRYVALLNKAVSLHLASRGLRKDPDRHRHYFTIDASGKSVSVTYETRTGRTQRLDVVREERFRDGQPKGVWWHQAVRLRFERIADQSWCMTVRPEFYLTSDGVEPLPSRRVGRKVTRRKSTMYNQQYLDRVHFWRWFLTGGTPRMIIKAGQPIIVGADPVEVSLRWPGVPQDDAVATTVPFEETLLSLAARADAVGNLSDWEDLIA